MEESVVGHKGEEKNEGQGLLAFFYGDALAKPVVHDNKDPETVRLAYKEVREEEFGLLSQIQPAFSLTN